MFETGTECAKQKKATWAEKKKRERAKTQTGIEISTRRDIVRQRRAAMTLEEVRRDQSREENM